MRPLSRVASTIGLLALALLAPGALAQEDEPGEILRVRIEGNRYISDETIRSMLKTRPGEPYSERVIRADERRLLASGRFDSVVATRSEMADGEIVTFVVQERPLIREILFAGNKKFSDKKLRKELAFAPGDPLNDYLVESGRQALLEKYRSEGHHRVKVTIDSAALEGNVVVYRIVEGPKVYVKKIRFVGDDSYWSLRLKQEIGSSRRFWPFISGNLDIEQVEQDVVSLRNFYISEGYLDVEVGRRLTFTADGKGVVLTFLIREGPRFRVNRLRFRGNEIYSDKELADRLTLDRGSYLESLVLRRDVERLKQTYGEIGFIEARTSETRRYRSPDAPPPEWATDLDDGRPALVDVVFDIEEGNQYWIDDITIRGNNVTQTRVIRRELGFFPGQLYNASAVEWSRSQLQQMRIFDEVRINPVGEEPNTRDISVEVTEGQTAQFMIGAGINSSSGLVGNVALRQRNFDLFRWPRSWRDFIRGGAFKGAAQTFSLRAEPGTELTRFMVDWHEPALFDQPYSLSLRGFLFDRQRESYDERRFGGVTSVGHRFRNRWYGELSSRIEAVEMQNLETDIPPEVAADADYAVMVGLKTTLVRDRTDSRWLPSEGDRTRLSYEQVMGDYQFGTLQADYRRYHTVFLDALDRKHILAGRVSVGQIFGDAPVYEHFYAGGLGSVRGFENRGISPRSRIGDDPIGGEFSLFAGTEYSFPLVGEDLRGVVFLDSGTVEETFGIHSYRVSTGFGLRWSVPFFGQLPMSLDFGFPLVKDDEDDTQIFSFSFGWMY